MSTANTTSNGSNSAAVENALHADTIVKKAKKAEKTAKKLKIEVRPVRRNLSFPFPREKAKTWHSDDIHTTNFFNALSVLFPEGEQFFIDSVRYYRDQGAFADNKQLLEDIRQFIGQEAMHGREHRDYNQLLEDAGLKANAMDALVGKLLGGVRKIYSPQRQLAATCALEHLTASLAHRLLTDPKILEGADEVFADAWRWHALEETEHKAVCFDAFEAAVGTDAKAYRTRAISMTTAMIVFWPVTLSFWARMNHSSGKLFDLRGWYGSFKFMFNRKDGVFRDLHKDLLDYYRRDFQPWDHDNREELNKLSALEARYSN